MSVAGLGDFIIVRLYSYLVIIIIVFAPFLIIIFIFIITSPWTQSGDVLLFYVSFSLLLLLSPKQQSLGDLLFLLRFLLLLLLLSLPNKVWGIYCFCSVSYYYYYYSYSYSYSSYSSSFFPCTMNLSMADLRNYRTEFHETWWSYIYMFLVDPKVFKFVVKWVKAIFLGVQSGWGLL